MLHRLAFVARLLVPQHRRALLAKHCCRRLMPRPPTRPSLHHRPPQRAGAGQDAQQDLHLRHQQAAAVAAVAAGRHHPPGRARPRARAAVGLQQALPHHQGRPPRHGCVRLAGRQAARRQCVLCCALCAAAAGSSCSMPSCSCVFCVVLWSACLRVCVCTPPLQQQPAPPPPSEDVSKHSMLIPRPRPRQCREACFSPRSALRRGPAPLALLHCLHFQFAGSATFFGRTAFFGLRCRSGSQRMHARFAAVCRRLQGSIATLVCSRLPHRCPASCRSLLPPPRRPGGAAAVRRPAAAAHL